MLTVKSFSDIGEVEKNKKKLLPVSGNNGLDSSRQPCRPGGTLWRSLQLPQVQISLIYGVESVFKEDC